MVAGSGRPNETMLRVKQLEEFIIATSTRIPPCFEYNTAWKNGDFTERQKAELNRFYIGVKSIDRYHNRIRSERLIIAHDSFTNATAIVNTHLYYVIGN